ncbi:hypothetical protein BS47DRAFT_1328516 [Hydnum rufescens UP504]|uniref:Uncharacterized protein n=1 Tax=Hydnum rufescens UP504 TaxID=1448309 RepID=A0A9P6DXN2_9AGAM|nr:hypothetical protein BS47DRAFT_1328516 [Hydnum rufescens UP504]
MGRIAPRKIWQRWSWLMPRMELPSMARASAARMAFSEATFMWLLNLSLGSNHRPSHRMEVDGLMGVGVPGECGGREIAGPLPGLSALALEKCIRSFTGSVDMPHVSSHSSIATYAISRTLMFRSREMDATMSRPLSM